jgi:hypothetical protein
MKTENTIENKVKFFALYWGSVIYNKEYKSRFTMLYSLLEGYSIEVGDVLELTSLSAITDEDAIKVGYVGNFHFLDEYKSQFKLNTFSVKAADYLRSKGYVLPYMDLSVDDLIEYEWVKLIDNEKI